MPETSFDSPLGLGSSAGLIFGNSGGVCEAALRTAYYFMTHENLEKDALKFQEVRGFQGVKEASVLVGDEEVHVAVVNGMKNMKYFFDKMKDGTKKYHFVEVMNCLGGCIAGGGQPKTTLLQMQDMKKIRMRGIYEEDERSVLRLCHENPEIKEIYSKFLEFPNSEVAHQYLHTSYEDKSYLLGGEKHE